MTTKISGSRRRFCIRALELGRGDHYADELARVVQHLHQLEAEEVLGLARGHLALGHALAEELVDGGAGVQDSADGAILHKQMQSLQLAITLGERAGLFWVAEVRGQH
jgi:hypothetical protein